MNYQRNMTHHFMFAFNVKNFKFCIWKDTEKDLLAIMNKNTDLIQKLSEVDLNLVEKVLQHLNYDDLEKRVAYAAYDMSKSFFFVDLKLKKC